MTADAKASRWRSMKREGACVGGREAVQSTPSRARSPPRSRAATIGTTVTATTNDAAMTTTTVSPMFFMKIAKRPPEERKTMGRKTHIVVRVDAAIGRRHLGGALEGCRARVLAEVLVVAEDRFDDHDRVVDQHADRQHEAHQRHDVEGEVGPAGLAGEVHEDESNDHRYRDRDRHQQGGAKSPQEEVHEDHRQHAAEEAGVAQLGETVAHVLGVVAVDVDLEALGLGEADGWPSISSLAPSIIARRLAVEAL